MCISQKEVPDMKTNYSKSYQSGNCMYDTVKGTFAGKM